MAGLASGDPRNRLAELVSAATDGSVSTEAALAPGASLTALGVGSLELLRVVDAVEDEYGIELDLELDADRLDSLDALAELVTSIGAHDDR